MTVHLGILVRADRTTKCSGSAGSARCPCSGSAWYIGWWATIAAARVHVRRAIATAPEDEWEAHPAETVSLILTPIVGDISPASRMARKVVKVD